MRRFKTIAPALALLLMVLWAYYPATQAGFIMDDGAHFIEDPRMTEAGGLYRIWFDHDVSIWNYWPISRSSFWVERRLWGVNAFASHLTNIVMHAGCVLLLYGGLRHFRFPNAWFIAALFAVHPIYVESVAWMTERKNVLSGLFFLGALWSYLHGDENRKRGWYAASLILFAGALLSKSSTIMLPVVLVLARFGLGKGFSQRDWIALIPFFLLSLISAYLSTSSESHHTVDSLFDRSFAERCAVAVRIPYFYLSKIVFPYPLIFAYPRWEITGFGILDFLFLSGMILVAFLLWKRRNAWGRPVLLGLAAFVVMLFPVLGFFDIAGMRISFVADRWAHLPSIPILMLAGAGLHFAFRAVRRAHWPVYGVVLLTLGVMTWNRSGIFADKETLWVETLAKNPASWFGHYNLAVALAEEGRSDEAVAQYKEALRLRPGYLRALYNLGNEYSRRGQPAEAEAAYRTALRIRPGHMDFLTNLVALLAGEGRIDDAVEPISEAIALQPDLEEAHYLLGRVRLRQGRTQDARQCFEEVTRLDSSHAEAHYQLGNLAVGRGDLVSARDYFVTALRIRPDWPEAHNNLGIVFLRMSRADMAAERFREALRLNPVYGDAQKNLREASRMLRGEK